MITKVVKMPKNDNGVYQMNKRGLSIRERIIEEIEYAESVQSEEDRKILATKALGAADMAVEFSLITYIEWEVFINRIFKMI